MDISGLRNAIAQDRFEWRRHTIERMIERRIRQDDVLSILKNGELIGDYLQDRPFPSGLFFGVTPNGPLHVVASFDSDADWAYIITAYVPDPEHFEDDCKTRKKS